MKTFTFALPDDLKAGLRAVRERDGIPEAEQIRRAVAEWLKKQGVLKKTNRPGVRTS